MRNRPVRPVGSSRTTARRTKRARRRGGRGGDRDDPTRAGLAAQRRRRAPAPPPGRRAPDRARRPTTPRGAAAAGHSSGVMPSPGAARRGTRTARRAGRRAGRQPGTARLGAGGARLGAGEAPVGDGGAERPRGPRVRPNLLQQRGQQLVRSRIGVDPAALIDDPHHRPRTRQRHTARRAIGRPALPGGIERAEDRLVQGAVGGGFGDRGAAQIGSDADVAAAAGEKLRDHERDQHERPEDDQQSEAHARGSAPRPCWARGPRPRSLRVPGATALGGVQGQSPSS